MTDNNENTGNTGKTKILLGLMPVWDPQIPPLGISCLKSHLRRHGLRVRTVDLNTADSAFRDIQGRYVETLKQWVPPDHWGNFYKVVHDVLQNHAMAHFRHTPADRDRYLELVKTLVHKTFHTEISTGQAGELGGILEDFFLRVRENVLRLLGEEQPTVFGLTAYGDTLPASLYALQLTRETHPHIKTVLGGGIFSDHLNVDSPAFADFLEQTPYIDKIIVGEGEQLFLKYLLKELPEDRRVYRLSDLGGDVLDIASVDIPDFTDLDVGFYPYLSTYASRSCAYRCKFCSERSLWGNYRKKDPRQVVDELDRLHQRHGGQLFLFGDSMINPVINGLSEECARLGKSFYWDGYLRADRHCRDVKNTLKWRRGGFYRARLGVESGSSRVLEMMDKQITPSLIKDALAGLAHAGIKTTTYWVVGYPGETEADFQETLRLLEEAADDIYEADCTPFRYFLSGQAGSGGWDGENNAFPLYGKDARDLLLIETWTMNTEPTREGAHDRMRRFIRHCRDLGIPNPYSLKELHGADQRWTKKQKNAVPPLVEFSRGVMITENIHIKTPTVAENKTRQIQDADFDF